MIPVLIFFLLENLKLFFKKWVLQSYKLVYGHKLIELEKNLEIIWIWSLAEETQR